MAGTFLRNIDNRSLIDEGLKTDAYDKAVISPALVDRWAEFQRAPGHRAILIGGGCCKLPASIAMTGCAEAMSAPVSSSHAA